jgi:hypothetical protein
VPKSQGVPPDEAQTLRKIITPWARASGTAKSKADKASDFRDGAGGTIVCMVFSWQATSDFVVCNM